MFAETLLHQEIIKIIDYIDKKIIGQKYQYNKTEIYLLRVSVIYCNKNKNNYKINKKLLNQMQ